MNKIHLLLSLISVIFFTGCISSVQKSVEYRNLHSETEFTESFFLDPFEEVEKNIFVHVANNSGFTNEPALTNQLKNNLISKGFRVVSSKKDANCILQVQLRSFKKQSLDEGRSDVSGYAAFTEGFAGTALLGRGDTSPAMAIAGGLGSVVLDAMVKAENYNLVSAIKISIKDQKGQWQPVETMALSHATQVNLSKESAAKAVSNDLAQSLSAIFS